jgi:hypothetical protein
MNTRTILFAIIAIALLARIAGLDQVLYGDELFYAATAKDQAYVNYYASHPPLSFWLHAAWAAMVGAAAWKARALVALFSLANIWLTYLLGRRFAGPKAGLWAAALLTLSAWFTAGSLQLDMDASFVSFFFLATTWAYLAWLDDRKPWQLALTGALLGLGMLTKYTAVLLGPIIALHFLLTRKPFNRHSFLLFLRDFALIAVFALAVFALPMAGLFLAGSRSVIFSFIHAFDLATGSTGPAVAGALVLQLLNALVWMSPLFAGALAYALVFSRSRTNVFLLWVLAVLAFYLFAISDPFRPIEKYLLIIAPPLAILAGAFLATTLERRKHLAVLGATAVVWFLFLGVFNLQPGLSIQFYPKAAFLAEALRFNLGLQIPLLGHAGPVGFSVLLGTILLTFLAAGALFLVSVAVRRKREAFALSIAVFFGLALGYNLYLGEEHLLGAVRPNVNAVSQEMLDTLLATDVRLPLFVFRNFAFEYPLEDRYGKNRGAFGEVCTTHTRFYIGEHVPCFDKSATFYLDFADEDDPSIAGLIRQKQPTIAVIDFPAIDKNSLLWQTFLECGLTKTFKDKDVILGYLFDCAEAPHD